MKETIAWITIIMIEIFLLLVIIEVSAVLAKGLKENETITKDCIVYHSTDYICDLIK